MNTVTDIAPLLQAIQSFGNWVLFFWLFMRERDRTQRVSDEHKADLRRLVNGKALHIETPDLPEDKYP